MWIIAGSCLGTPALASSDPANFCDQVAAEAARRSGVPISVLKAISLTETGRKHGGAVRPWPWTVNMEGKGFWFETEDEARAYVYKEYKRGARSFDIGCFQINYKWHGTAFRSIDEMFDPLANALYAAKFLKSLHAEQGDWGRAAGAYHSRTPKFATRYQARFERFRTTLLSQDGDTIPEIPDIVRVANGDGPDTAGPAVVAEARVNTYPLLQAGGNGALGSLVPLGPGGGASLFGPRAAPTEVN
nr:transglycosylase SLT domain-containing protein [Defluviimonas aquaemixtae]